MRSIALLAALIACAPSGRKPANTALTPATHTKFQIATGPHAVDCNSCHGAFDSFAQFTCLSCHAHEQAATGALHARVQGYAYDSASCLRCHPNGDATPFADVASDPAHDLVVQALIPAYSGFTIATLTPRTETLPMPMNHGAISPLPACATCHSGAQYFPGVFHAAVAAQPSQCLGCHAASMPSGLVGPVDDTRTPPSGAMRHESAPQDCSVCHATSAWTGAQVHAPLGNAQPSTCFECHANSRSRATLTLATGTVFDHTSAPAMADCAACHASHTTWTGGTFHVANPSLSSCVACHEGERPVTTAGWSGQSPSFDAVTNAAGVKHGAGLDCAACHATTQTWAGGHYTHASGASCVECHMTQRPDLQANATAAGMATALGFDHARDGTGDCAGCHQATVMRGAYATYGYDPATQTFTNSDWRGGLGYPGSTLIGSVAQSIAVTETYLTRSGGWITGSTSFTATLYNQMKHTSTAVPAAIAPGPDGSPNYSTCSNCHGTGGFAGGTFHPALTTLGYPQPSSQCLDCHVNLLPSGIVGPETAAMDHAAFAGVECSTCHSATAGSTWSSGALHAHFDATGSDCASCHYPLMADPAQADVTNGTLYRMSHRSPQMTVQDCAACHSIASFQGGAYHSKMPAQPTSCLDCHAVSTPAGLTNSSTQTTADTAPAGTFDQISHADANVAGRDCVACHTSTSVWTQAAFHANTASLSPSGRCSDCHLNLKPGATFAAQDHSSFSATPGTTDCVACHTSTSTWLGAASAPQYIVVGGFTIPAPPAPAPTTQVGVANLPHPTVATGETCASCHSDGGGKNAIGYDHASTVSDKSCDSCHETGSNLLGTPWNGTTKLGDTRPYTLASVRATYKGNTSTETTPNHFYLDKAGAQVDCYRCHVKPAPTSLGTTTGTAYATAWAFKHPPESPTYNFCWQCHPNGPPQ